MAWKLEDWETTIQQIVGEIRQAPKRSAKQKVIDSWRAKLEKEPPHLQPFQIDVIIREVQRRLRGISE
jgi:hypothetical protein